MEDATNGRLVIDGSIGSLGMVERPFRIRLEGGVIKDLQLIWCRGKRPSRSLRRSAGTTPCDEDYGGVWHWAEPWGENNREYAH
jgi:hypothetical protein